MGYHPIHFFIFKCESDGPHSVYILKKIVNRMWGIQFSIFYFKKIKGPFGHFHRDNFKTYGGAGRGYWGAERICLYPSKVVGPISPHAIGPPLHISFMVELTSLDVRGSVLEIPHRLQIKPFNTV